MKAAIYLRCSTSEQDTSNQLAPLEKLAAARGWEIRAVYRENETAWKAGHQAELARMFTDAAHRKYDIILIFALDRLTRMGPSSILNMINTLAIYGCKVISYSEPWTEAPGIAGEILLAVSGWVAKMESDRKSQNTRAGLAKARLSGGGRRGCDKQPRKRRWLKRPLILTPVFVGPGNVETKRL